MALQCNDLTKEQTQQNLYEVRGDDNALQKFLTIQPPDNAAKTPPILAFRRKREVEIPWAEIVEDENVTGAVSIAAIREYFEKSWGFPVDEEWMKDPAHHLLDTGAGSWRVKQLQQEKSPSIFRPDFDKLDAQGKPTPAPLSEGFVIRHGSGDKGRLYLLVNGNKTLSPEHFRSFDMYNSAWKNEIDGVELVFESSEDAQSYFMDFEEIDLRPVLIQRKYEELRILHDFAKKVKDNVAGVTEKMISQIIATTLDTDELEQLQRKVLRLEIGEYEMRKRIKRLASDAARLGYLLFVEEKAREIEYGDKKKTTLEPGKLYTTYKRTARWTEFLPKNVQVKVGWWIYSLSVTRKVEFWRPKEQVVEDYKVVDTSKDIYAETRSTMIKAGLQVYTFEQTPSGMVSTDGEPLHQIMDRCKYDEAFRRVCVVMLPVYEESLTGERLVAKYAIYKRPLPGIVPTILPRLSLEESLTYRTAWVQTQLGELLNSINLAPDEERKVTITKRFELETTVNRTSTSIFDISRAETSDLATEMEKQTRQEQENSKSLQFSTKASGSFGPFSAEASASGGTNSSLKDMSQAISKVAKKAAKSVSSQNREEVSSTTTSRTTISNTDETVATIRNINQGRSLNLMFYRLYNKYSGGLFLEGLSFNVIPSVEVIAGSGVHTSKSYSLEELPRLIAEFKASQLPFAIKDEDRYTEQLLKSIEALLITEYSVGSETDDLATTDTTDNVSTARTPVEQRAEATSVSVARLSFSSPQVHRVGLQAGLADVDSNLAKLSEDLRQAVIYSDDPIAPQELLVAAPGLYLDAAVGVQPSTEPYSERMREQTVALKMAEVALTQADASYREALAHHLVRNDENLIVGVTPQADRKTLTLTLKFPLAAGRWDFVLDGEKQGEVPADQLGNYKINLRWKTDQEWLDDPGLTKRCLELHDYEKGIVLKPA
jgi:hypothetical protein